MVDRKKMLVTLILFSVALVVQLLFGALAGLGQDWMRMSIFFFTSFVIVYCCVGFLLGLRIDSSFRRLEDLISKKSDSVRPGNQVVSVVSRVLHVFMVVSVAVQMSLAIFAGLRQDWLWLGVLLAASAITFVICGGVLMALRIHACSKRLEELISKPKDDKASKEQSGE